MALNSIRECSGSEVVGQDQVSSSGPIENAWKYMLHTGQMILPSKVSMLACVIR